MEEVVRFTAGLFDELILDDFFFTTTKSESDIQAKGARSWSAFRLDLMKEASQSLIVGPAKAVNPKIKVVIKYPNWYEHFAYAGFDLEAEPKIFDGIYTGTETRDSVMTHQHLQTYQSYSIMRYFENVKPGGNGGGWVDPFARVTLDRYAEQIELTVLAKAREITLFCFSDLMSPIRQPDGSMKASSRVAPVAGETLERADALLSRLGNPVGVSAYKPYHSSGEDFLHSFLGMIGIPIELTPQFREDAPVVFLNESVRFDPTIVARIDKQLRAGKSIVITTGLLKALQGKGIEQIVDLEVSDRRVLTRRFSNFWGGVWEADRDILLPQVRYATNDSWEEITALAGENGFPLLHHADYGSGRLYVLTIPDNFADIYALPAPALDHIRRVVTKGLPVRLQGPSRVSLFAYDNDTYVVHSFLDRMGSVELVADGRDVTLVDLQTGAVLPGQPRGDATAFSVFLEPHSYRAFARRRAGTSGASARAFGVNQRLAIVRATNPTRTVIVGGGRWNSIDGLQTLVLPEDDRNLIATVHYYTPMDFTHQGAPWNKENKDKSGVPWTGTDQERRRIELDFAKAQQWAAEHDRPLLLGEFGAYDKADMDSRARYTAAVARVAERMGWSWSYWQFDSDFVVYDIGKDAWVEPLRNALVP